MNLISDKNTGREMHKKGGFLKILFILLLIIAVASTIGIIKIKFMVGEQLRLAITPEYLEAESVSPGNVTFEIDMKLYNKFLCEASCRYTLTDMSNNILIDNGTFLSKAFRMEHYEHDIPLTYNGYGTNLYLYTLQCVNNYTAVCPANQDDIVRKSLMVVSYSPSEEQLSSLEYVKENYASISQNFVTASADVSESGQILEAVDFPFDRKRYAGLESGNDALEDYIGELLNIWRTDDYTAAQSYIESNGVSEKSQSLLSDASSYKDYLYRTVGSHNLLVDEFSAYYPVIGYYSDVLSLNQDLSYLNDSEQASVLNFLLKSDSTIENLNSEMYDFTRLSADAMSLRNATADLDRFIVHRAAYGLMDNYASIYVYSKLLCLLESTDGDSLLCTDIINTYPGNVSDALKSFEKICTLASEVRSESESLISSPNQTDSAETLLLQYRFISDYESWIAQEGASVEGVNPSEMLASSAVLPIYKNYIVNTLAEDYGIVGIESQIDGLDVNQSEISLGADNILLDDVLDVWDSCRSGSGIKSPEISRITTKHYTIPSLERQIIEAIPAPVNIPQCCIYDKCQSCESHNTQNPLIMLHGHSFNKDIDAYRAIESFDGFEYAFMADNLYFLTGMMISGTESTKAILGRYTVPVAIKPTYYLETYKELLGLMVSESKDDDIDTYALRLKESIDYVRYITGNDKVDIVAHSMGGLVVRRYMQIFGTKDVGTVILIGTPNKGINENTYNLCRIFGATAECTDMRNDSLFMKKLNDPSNQPDISRMYLVVGKGCETEDSDGDGVVPADSVLVEGVPENHILYVEGDCSEIGGFHRQLLYVDEYPEVYEFVKEKLWEGAD